MNTEKSINSNGGGKFPVKIPGANISESALAGVRFTFCLVTPELAADWLKANRKNRGLKDSTVESYAIDMRIGAWRPTHQGIAFDDQDNLIDGQHRLHAIVRAKVPVLILVTTGWPTAQAKLKTMDAVDRGCTRTLADQLHLQHDIAPAEAKQVVQICNAIAAACFGLNRVSKSTTDSILGVFNIYKAEIQWLLQNPIKQNGLKNSAVKACLVMGRSIWADKTNDALNRLQTGENLSKENPILQLRNWLLDEGAREEFAVIAMATFYHLAAFVDGASTPYIIINKNSAYIRVLKVHKVRVEKICAIYNRPVPELLNAQTDPGTKPAAAINGASAEAVKIGQSLTDVFTNTDLRARTDENVSTWLTIWRNKKWIEPSGVNQFRKLPNFGKAG